MSATAFARPTGLTWTVLRLHRVALRLWTAYVALTAAALVWLWGPGTNGLDISGHCRSGSVSGCTAEGPTGTSYHYVITLVDGTLTALPFAVAVFAGAVLVGRELERGTAHLAWTQGVTPARWLAAKLFVPALLLTTGTGLLVLLRHAVAARARGLNDNVWFNGAYDVLGPTAVALPLLGLACGVLGAVLQRKMLAAGGLAAVLLLLLSVCVKALHPHLWPARTVISKVEVGYTGVSGDYLDEGAVTSSGAHIADPICVDDKKCLADHDVVGYFSSYHPASHFWPLQLVESAVLLGLAAAVSTLAFLVLRKRVAA
ncbi:ABC transporter permease [Streptomyces sp. NPDC050095]|uniref:ABC transporter permease n=1 Tax=unclassified Streptomyces TaxID=2593676 RepID=UPI003415D5C4